MREFMKVAAFFPLTKAGLSETGGGTAPLVSVSIGGWRTSSVDDEVVVFGTADGESDSCSDAPDDDDDDEWFRKATELLLNELFGRDDEDASAADDDSDDDGTNAADDEKFRKALE